MLHQSLGSDTDHAANMLWVVALETLLHFGGRRDKIYQQIVREGKNWRRKKETKGGKIKEEKTPCGKQRIDGIGGGTHADQAEPIRKGLHYFIFTVVLPEIS